MNRNKTINAIWALHVSLACCLFVGCSSLDRRADVERYIVEGARQWADSVQTGDTTALERILADDFIGINPEGNFYDTASMISYIRNAPNHFLSNSLNDVKVRFYGNMAIAQGDESWVRRNGNIRGRFVWTDTWVKRNGQWQIVAAQDVIASENSP